MPELFAGKPISRRDATHLASVMKALADPTRLQMLSILRLWPGEATVMQLVGALAGPAQPTVSHHLTVLEAARFIYRRKDSVHVRCRLAPAGIAACADALRPGGGDTRA